MTTGKLSGTCDWQINKAIDMWIHLLILKYAGSLNTTKQLVGTINFLFTKQEPEKYIHGVAPDYVENEVCPM